MNIVIVTETFLPATDGVVTRLTHAIDYMLRMGHSVTVYCPDLEGTPATYKQARIRKFPAYTFFFYKQRPWALPTKKVKEALLEDQPDVVHAVNPIALAASGIYYADQLDIPLIASFHTNIPNYLAHYGFSLMEPLVWVYLRKLHNTAAANMVTSQAMHDLLADNGIPDAIVLPKGVDVDQRHPRFTCQEWRQDHLFAGTDKLMLFVGRLAPEKQIDSIRDLLDQRQDVSLVIVGDGPDKERLEEHYSGYPVSFTGFLHGEDLSRAFASADAFIFPSTSETLGLVITEAMASGTPVIAANSQPTAEQVDHLDNGFVYESGDLVGLSACVDFLGDEVLMGRVRAAGRTYAEGFSWDRASQAILDAYQLVIENSQRLQLSS